MSRTTGVLCGGIPSTGFNRMLCLAEGSPGGAPEVTNNRQGATRATTSQNETARSLAQMDSRRQLAEVALGESEERYRLLLDGIEDYAIYMVSPEGTVMSWNAGAKRIKGYSAGEIIGKNFSCFFPQEDILRGRPQEILRKTAYTGRHEERGMRVRKDGSRFLASLTFTALRDAAGNLRGFSEFSHDLSASKESDAKYQGLLEAAPDAMVVVNQRGEITLLNVQAEKQFGYRSGELMGENVTSIIPQGFAERLVADKKRTVSEALAQQIGTGVELVGQRKDGSQFPIEMMLSPLESMEGILVTAAIRNITRRKESEQARSVLESEATALHRAQTKLEARVFQRTKELAMANRELEQSNLELKQFAYIASHDLQTPLRTICGFVQLLELEYGGKLDEQAREWIQGTVQATLRMQALIRDLLSFSRVDTRSLPFARLPLLEIVADAVNLLQSSIKDSGGQVTWDPLPSVMGDRSQLVELLQQLIGNGLTYRAERSPHIHLSAERSGKKWIISVRDNGLGIDDKYYEQIFEMFTRLHNQKEYPGTGIGLALCRRVVRRHGGEIWVRSEPGVGSTFAFTIPEGNS